jgi:N-methylhydantoinase A
MVEGFHRAYEDRYGNRFALPVQGVTYRVQVILPIDKVEYREVEARDGGALEPSGSVILRHLGDGEQEADEYQRADLRAGDQIAGPAIIREDLSTTHVGANQRATIGRYGEIVIEKNGEN